MQYNDKRLPCILEGISIEFVLVSLHGTQHMLMLQLSTTGRLSPHMIIKINFIGNKTIRQDYKQEVLKKF